MFMRSSSCVETSRLISRGSLRVVAVTEGAQVVGVVASWSLRPEPVDVVDVSGRLDAPLLVLADGMRAQVLGSGASPLGSVATLGCAEPVALGRPALSLAAWVAIGGARERGAAVGGAGAEGQRWPPR